MCGIWLVSGLLFCLGYFETQEQNQTNEMKNERTQMQDMPKKFT